MVEQYAKQAEEKMKKSLSMLNAELAKIRTGRAHPSIFDHIVVDYYGNKAPLNQVCNITIEGTSTLALNVWEKHMIEEIEKVITNADLGLNPAVNGNIMHIKMPPLTEERRKELVKVTRQHGEAAKVAIRNIRRDNNQHVKHALKNKEISQDEDRSIEEVIQKVTDTFITNIDKMLADKEKELMAV